MQRCFFRLWLLATTLFLPLAFAQLAVAEDRVGEPQYVASELRKLFPSADNMGEPPVAASEQESEARPQLAHGEYPTWIPTLEFGFGVYTQDVSGMGAGQAVVGLTTFEFFFFDERTLSLDGGAFSVGLELLGPPTIFGIRPYIFGQFRESVASGGDRVALASASSDRSVQSFRGQELNPLILVDDLPPSLCGPGTPQGCIAQGRALTGNPNTPFLSWFNPGAIDAMGNVVDEPDIIVGCQNSRFALANAQANGTDIPSPFCSGNTGATESGVFTRMEDFWRAGIGLAIPLPIELYPVNVRLGVAYQGQRMQTTFINTEPVLASGAVTIDERIQKFNDTIHGVSASVGLDVEVGRAGPLAISLFFDTQVTHFIDVDVRRASITTNPVSVNGVDQNIGRALFEYDPQDLQVYGGVGVRLMWLGF